MKVRFMTGAVIALCFVAGISVHGAEQKNVWKGKVDGFIQIFSEDVLYLENEIRNLMSECGRELN